MRRAEALQKLEQLVLQIEDHLASRRPSEGGISEELLTWLLEGSVAALKGRCTLTQALGLDPPPHRPSADDAESVSAMVCKAYVIRLLDVGRQHRKRNSGKNARAMPRRLTWERIALRVGHQGTPDDLIKQVHRHQKTLIRLYAERIVRRMQP